MPSWWTRRCQIIAQDNYKQQQKSRNNEREKSNVSKTRIASNKRKQNIEKEKSFEETVLVSHQFSRASSIPKRPSFYEIFHSEKQVYPLPQPSRSLELASVKFASEPASSSSSSSSESSTSASSGADVSGDHRDFGFFMLVLYSCSHYLFIFCGVIVDSYLVFSHLQPKWIKGRLLGRGSFGQVYAGFNSTNGQLCAIKEMRSICEDQNSEAYLKEINQEVAVLSQLSHRNIVQYYGSELGKGKLSLYLEYVSGGSIHKLLQEYGPFKESLIRSYTRQILHAIAYLHARNVVHRDIKGTNILVDPNGIIKLADFGMAKHITTSSTALSFKGSPHWMAPEVILNTSCVGLAVDIWSLGCTIIEMATSKPPWSKYKGVTAIFKIANSNDYPQIPSQLSEDAQIFLKLCLQRDPLLRPSAAQLLHHPFIQEDS
ncbi:Mitogen-activated protein kinase kinase kinase YODA [Spatholobus suberectus]|nr:Mitogen-activated protein kinase kinase kinase YODA [Spatholobus suberectus]